MFEPAFIFSLESIFTLGRTISISPPSLFSCKIDIEGNHVFQRSMSIGLLHFMIRGIMKLSIREQSLGSRNLYARLCFWGRWAGEEEGR
jgi:hypothetical protein